MAGKRFSIRIFLAEMKRRRVTRVITIYTVVGLGIIELTDIIGGRFLLPEWLVQLIIILVIAGFPVTVVLSWIFDISPGGIQRTESLPPQELSRLSPISWRPSWLTFIMLLIIVALTVTYCTVPRPNILGYNKTDWILISDLENNTSDEVFNKSLVHALRVSIGQSRYVNILPQSQVSAVLSRMKKEGVKSISTPVALEIAQREHVKAVLSLAISEVGNTFLISSSLIDAGTGDAVRSRSITVRGREEILPSMSRLCKKIRKDLGEALNEIHFQTVSLPKATTSSLDALKSMTDGNIAWTVNGDLDEAERLFLNALELDPEFAAAHSLLGSLYYWQDQRDKGETHFDRALTLSERLTDKEKLYIQARIERFRGNYDEAILQYRVYLRRYPNDSNGWFSLGYCYFRLDRYEEAIEAFNRSMEIHQQKDPNTFINVASCYSQLKQYDQAIAYYQEAFQLNPNLLTVPNLNHEYGFTCVEAGETAKAREVFGKMLESNSEGTRARGLRSMAHLAMYTGNFTEAEELLLESIQIYQRLDDGSELSEYRDRLFLAVVYQSMGENDQLQKELEQAESLTVERAFGPWWFMLLGKLYIRNGEIEKGKLLAEEVSSRVNEGNRSDKASMYLLQGEIELALGNAEDALTIFEKAVNERRDGYTLESLANHCMVTGDYPQAVQHYTEILEMHSLGWEAQPYWVEAHYKLAQLFEKQGDMDKAREYYQIFLEFWEDGDRGLPLVSDAREKLNSLQT